MRVSLLFILNRYHPHVAYGEGEGGRFFPRTYDPTAPAYLLPAHRLVHISSVRAGSVAARLNVRNVELEEKHPRYRNPPMVSRLCAGTMLSVGEGNESKTGDPGRTEGTRKMVPLVAVAGPYTSM